MSRIGRFAMAALALAAVTTPARAQANEAQPVLGFADRQTTIMGAATAGAPGETWAFRQLPLGTPPLLDAAGTLGFGPIVNAAAPVPQLVFATRRPTRPASGRRRRLRSTRKGAPYRGPQPNVATARVTARGGGALVGRDSARPTGKQAVVLVRDAGDGSRFRVLPDAAGWACAGRRDDRPRRGRRPCPDRGLRRGARRRRRLAPRSSCRSSARRSRSAIAHWDGRAWSREPIELPTTPAPVRFTVVALAAGDADDAYLLATTEADRGDGILLFARVDDARGVRWEPRDLGARAARFAVATTTADGIEQVATLAGDAQQPLTATADGVWIDGTMRLSGGLQRDFTLSWSKSAGAVSGSWCDATGPDGGALCDRSLGFRFGRRAGYRSFAFARRRLRPPRRHHPAVARRRRHQQRRQLGRLRRRRLPAQRRRRLRLLPPGGRLPRRPTEAGWKGPSRSAPTAPEPPAARGRPAGVAALTAAGGRDRPGGARGSLASAALAVGASKAPSRASRRATGWKREYLLTSTGAVTAAPLRGVAWPEAGRAYAVGDLGAMWLWRKETGLWERDAAAPDRLRRRTCWGSRSLRPTSLRGYAVGKEGTILRLRQVVAPGAAPGRLRRTATSTAHRLRRPPGARRRR